jgi:phenylalanyl-tRNA synthetase alpha subunit
MNIDYQILADSTEFYELRGFKRIETPWTVTEAVSQITKPEFKSETFTLDKKKKVLVGSGEQSFLYLYLKGFLPKGRYQTITPCFREEVFDFTHTKYFMKNELIITDDNIDHYSAKGLASIAFAFYSEYFNPDDLEIVETEDGFDIMYEKYELGSYGYRECEFLKWIYGTGVAEPRFSNVLKLYKNAGQ